MSVYLFPACLEDIKKSGGGLEISICIVSGISDNVLSNQGFGSCVFVLCSSYRDMLLGRKHHGQGSPHRNFHSAT